MATPEIEEWKPVVGQEGRYEVSDMGQVRSVTRRIPESNNRLLIGRVLKQSPDSAGYPVVGLGRGDRIRVHRLVAEAWCGATKSDHVRHLNDIKNDNRACNLAPGNCSDNMQDRIANGLHHYSKRDRCKWGHEYLPGSYYIRHRNGGTSRVCKPCKRGEKYEEYKKPGAGIQDPATT